MSRNVATEDIRAYWNAHIHDQVMSTHPVGSRGFFKDLEEYRFDKLRYLPQVVDFSSYAGKKVLEVGCGIGIDLARFAKVGAHVTGIDLSQVSIELAKKNFQTQGLSGTFKVMDGEALEFPEGSFDLVYGHGVLPYTKDPNRMIVEIRRVLCEGGETILQVYNRCSWLNALSKLTKVELEHVDAPVLRKYSPVEFKKLVSPFSSVELMIDRFPVKSRLHKGVKAFFYNTLFVGAFNLIPRYFVRSLGWHMLVKARK